MKRKFIGKLDCSGFYEFDNKFQNKQERYLNIVENYIEYYHMRAYFSKYFYYICSTIKIMLVALIPVIQLLDLTQYTKIIITMSSAIILIIEGILSLYKSKYKWFLYRDTCNILLSELRKYQAKADDGVCYCTNEFIEFVDTAESIIDDEARKWIRLAQKKEEDKNK